MYNNFDEVYAESQIHRASVNIYLAQKIDGVINEVKPVDFVCKRLEAGMPYSEPALSFSMQTTQRLFDELYLLGFRPNNGQSSIAHVDALNKHLNDMRKIAFNGLKIE